MSFLSIPSIYSGSRLNIPWTSDGITKVRGTGNFLRFIFRREYALFPILLFFGTPDMSKSGFKIFYYGEVIEPDSIAAVSSISPMIRSFIAAITVG